MFITKFVALLVLLSLVFLIGSLRKQKNDFIRVDMDDDD